MRAAMPAKRIAIPIVLPDHDRISGGSLILPEHRNAVSTVIRRKWAGRRRVVRVEMPWSDQGARWRVWEKDRFNDEEA